MADLLDIIENTEDICLFAADETGILLEFKNHYSWSPKGKPTIIEQNGCRKGLNIIGATEISKNFSIFTKAYSAINSLTAHEIVCFLKDLIGAYPNKTLIVILDNARIHTARVVQDFATLYKDKLHLIFQPPYSPQLNPQENIRKYFKDECSESNSYKNKKEPSG